MQSKKTEFLEWEREERKLSLPLSHATNQIDTWQTTRVCGDLHVREKYIRIISIDIIISSKGKREGSKEGVWFLILKFFLKMANLKLISKLIIITNKTILKEAEGRSREA